MHQEQKTLEMRKKVNSFQLEEKREDNGEEILKGSSEVSDLSLVRQADLHRHKKGE